MTANFIDPRSLQGITDLLAASGLHANKHLGQHFLTDEGTFHLMARQVASAGPEWVLEVGPGPGGLTVSLLEQGLKVVAIELDPLWVKWLETTLALDYPGQLTVIQGDAVALSWRQLAVQHPGRFSICGNLPYYASSALVAKLFEDVQEWDTAVLMLQKEVAERLVASPGQRQTSALSVLLRYVADITPVGPVPRTAFYPPPEVDSFVIQLTRRPSPAVALEDLQRAVRTAFLHRRKMLRQSLAMAPRSVWDSHGWADALLGVGLDPAKRPEALSWEDWIVLAKLVATK